MFKEKYAIPVGGCTIEYKAPKILKLIGKVIESFTPDESKDTSQVVNFDWDGKVIFTPCDYGLGANVWSIYNGHIKRYDGNNENYATLTALKCGSGVVFGNGRYLFYSDGYRVLIELKNTDYKFDIKNIVADKTNGSGFFSIKFYEDNLIIPSFFIEYKQKIKYSEFTINHSELGLQHEWDKYSSQTQIEQVKLSRDKYILVAYQYCSMYAPDGYKNLVFFDPFSQIILGATSVEGLQSICKHPVKDVFLTIGKELCLWTFPDCQLLKSVTLDVARDDDYMGRGGVSYSSCGRYIAITYAITGEVEIRDSESLEIIKILEGDIGLGNHDLSWDVSSKFIACRYYLRKAGPGIIKVWEVNTGRLMLEEMCSSFRGSPMEKSFYWSPHSTSLAILQNMNTVKIFEYES